MNKTKSLLIMSSGFAYGARKNLPDVLEFVHQTLPRAYLSIEDVRSTEEGIFRTYPDSKDGMLFGRKSK